MDLFRSLEQSTLMYRLIDSKEKTASDLNIYQGGYELLKVSVL